MERKMVVEKVRAMVDADPSLTAPAIAKTLGVSNQYIYRMLINNGIKVARANAKKTPAKRGSTLEKFNKLYTENQSLTAAAMAVELGITKEHVYNIANKHGVKLVRAHRVDKRVPRDRPAWTTPFGNREKLSAHFIGGTSEMYVCADLLSKGFPVYRAITFVSPADLVAEIHGKLYRVEVKSARRTFHGKLQFSAPFPERRDLLALAENGGIVTYRPSLDSLVPKVLTTETHPIESSTS